MNWLKFMCRKFGLVAGLALSMLLLASWDRVSAVSQLTSLNNYNLSANQSRWLYYIGSNVKPLLPGSPEEQAAMAARVAWWSLKEGELGLDNPFGYSNCGAGGDHVIGLTETCANGAAWQVGIASVQVPNFSASEVEGTARARHPGTSLQDILGQAAVLAGAQNGSASYNTIVNSSGTLRKSWLLRDPATGFTLVDHNIQAECINAWRSWCNGSWNPAKYLATTPAVAQAVISELANYFSGVSASAGQLASAGDCITTGQVDYYKQLQYPFYDLNTICANTAVNGCSLLSMPNITNEAEVIKVINQYIADNSPSESPLRDLGRQIFAGAKRSGINPFVIVSIAQIESSFGTAGIATGGTHNAFGRTAGEGQPSKFIGDRKWYLWPSWAASVNGPNDESAFLKSVYLDAGLITLEDVINKYAPPSENETSSYIQKLTDIVSNLTTAAASGIACTSSGGGGIVATALLLAWPGPHSPSNEPKPEYSAAPPTSVADANCGGADCGVFVSTVMRASGADPNYPISGTAAQMDYVQKNSGKYDLLQLGPSNSTADLLPGDILIVNQGSGEGANGHTYIYVGNNGGDYNAASSSWSSTCSNSRMPSLGNAYINDSRGYYTRVRLK